MGREEEIPPTSGNWEWRYYDYQYFDAAGPAVDLDDPGTLPDEQLTRDFPSGSPVVWMIPFVRTVVHDAAALVRDFLEGNYRYTVDHDCVPVFSFRKSVSTSRT